MLVLMNVKVDVKTGMPLELLQNIYFLREITLPSYPHLDTIFFNSQLKGELLT